jgi:hypothetical protein
MKTKPPKTRDWLLVKLINGATKSGVVVDKKKEESRNSCRRNQMTTKYTIEEQTEIEALCEWVDDCHEDYSSLRAIGSKHYSDVTRREFQDLKLAYEYYMLGFDQGARYA